MPEDDQIVELPLTPEQSARLFSLVREQPKRRKGLLFVSAGPTVTSTGTILRLQCKWLAWPKAQAVLRLINAPTEVKAEETERMASK